MDKHSWKEKGRCFGFDTNLFFDRYEEDERLRLAIDDLCRECPVRKLCFAVGINGKEWGVWGGVYLENGDISREFNKHRTKESWGKTWASLTLE